MNMKKLLSFIGCTAVVIVFLITSCTKEGPQGPPGANGQNGKDANATCTLCHNFSDTIVAKIFQYDASQHATGTTTFENRNTCAPCHTSQGFIEVVGTGKDTTAVAIQDAAPINCRTCHKIHNAYDRTDWELRTTAAFTNRIGGTTDLTTDQGDATGNLCARCHQARKPNPWLTNPTSTTDTLNITNFRWGPHYGTQSLILGGQGAFEIGAFDGPGAYRNSYHKGKASCVMCHGANAVGNLTGGHTLWLANEEEGDNFNGCNSTGCHTGLNTFDYDGKQTEVAEKIATLEEKLLAVGMLDSATHYLVKGKYCQKQLAVWWNYKLVVYDRSLGVHNTKYVLDMTQAGIDFFTTLGY
jgi:mono/diheme cytochrome c family protein